MDVAGKVVLITSGTRGLGKELAFLLVGKGAKVVIGGKKEDLGSEGAGKDILSIEADLSREEEVKRVVEETIKELGNIHVLIHQVDGKTPPLFVEKMEINGLREMVDQKIIETGQLVQHILPVLKKNEGGMMIHVLSGKALTGMAGNAAEVVGQHAVAGFTRTLRMEISPPIWVMNVYPDSAPAEGETEENPTNKEMEKTYIHKVAETIVANMEQEKPMEEMSVPREETN